MPIEEIDGAADVEHLRRVLESRGKQTPSLAFVPPEQLADLHARIDDAALAAGRAPSDISRIYNVWGAHSPQDWVEMLTEFTLEHGMNSYVFGAPPTESALRTIGEEIAPAVREAVATARG